jgi:nucleotide-binding universal stress UspA family protein
MYKRILAPIDGSPTSMHGLDEAIVMGTHGRRGMARLILRSDAQAVLHGTTVPVLLVRGQAEE